MILKNNTNIVVRSSRSLLIYKGIAVLMLLATVCSVLWWISAFSLFKTQATGHTTSGFILLGDAEAVSGENFRLGAYMLSGASGQSKDYAFEGDFSMKLGAPDVQFGFGYEIPHVLVGTEVKVRVWTYSPFGNMGCLAVAAKDMSHFYQESCVAWEEKNGWMLLELNVIIDKKLEDDVLKVYCYNMSDKAVYFDNLSYAVLAETKSTWKPENVRLVLKEGEYLKLKQKRDVALKKGILISEDDSWAKGAIYPKNEKEDKIKISLRLKGDWTDHLEGEQWSFRVQTEPEKSWNRLKVFSLQTPQTRSYLHEWVLHKFFAYEDVLTTRYDFVTLMLNDKELGLYVYEEHFVKQIPEYNLKREGPIVKFTENGFWEGQLQVKETKGKVRDFIGASKANPDIRPFQEGKTTKSEGLARQYEIAQNLMYSYQYGLLPAKDIFDLDVLAKYYAITDIMGGHHGIVWHNQRYYYNPVIGKLEPIGFDGFGETVETWLTTPFIGMNRSTLQQPQEWHNRLFLDVDFLRKYYYYLNEFSGEKYMRDFVDTIRTELRQRLSCIRKYKSDYNFSPTDFYKRAAEIQVALLPTETSLHSRTVAPGLLALCNRHSTPLEVLGTATAQDGMLFRLDSVAIVFTTPATQLPDFSKQIQVPKEAKYLVYRLPGIDKVYYVEINPWSVPEAYTPMQELESNLQAEHAAYYYDKATKKVVFKKNGTTDEPIIIPAEHRVVFEAGSKLDITKKAFVLSYSPVFFNGTEEEPILVTSSDASANGFTVIKAAQKSNLNYVTFSNMNTLAYKGWNLTGAVTFYESDVEMQYSTFTENHCEDALNVIRSNFYFNKSTISYTFGDGFDADFCTGTVDNSYFFKTGNDGIDFSTSVITIRDTRIDSVGDKGISIGEQGTTTIINTHINGAVIGIASKDLSQVTVVSATLKNCQDGFAAYQKKPEYGGGFLYVESYEAENVKTLYKILPDSYLKLIDKEIVGNDL